MIFVRKLFLNQFKLTRLNYSAHTIFGLSSGQGKCGVAVVRVSGPKSLSVLQSVAGFQKSPLPRHAYLRKLYHPTTGDLIDKGLILWFPGPNSFTGEDSCEFQIHGGPAVITALLSCLNSINGLRQAKAGEFTKRSFYAGKLDLTEVEGLADLIHAETEYQRKQALLQANGSLSKLYSKWRDQLLKCTSHFEAYIDFAEDQNINESIFSELDEVLSDVQTGIRNHLNDSRKGEILRDGVRAVILGAPNVGKSSFMNKICGNSISIVSNIEGTTRDIIERPFNISGYPVIFADTAGLRKNTKDIVEAEGISRALNYAQSSDLIIMIIDAIKLKQYNFDIAKYYFEYLKYLEIDDTFLENAKSLIVVNKIDLLLENEIMNLKQLENVTYISCLTDVGVSNSVEKLSLTLRNICGEPSAELPTISQQRHRNLLEGCLQYLNEFRYEGGHQDLGIAAHKLRMAVRFMGQITGDISTEDILDVIFKDFCIGK